MAFVYISNVTSNWANSSNIFTAIKMNVTDSASNSESLLLDLQVDGNSKVSVGKTGDINLVDGANINGDIDFTGNVDISGQLNVGGDIVYTDNLTVSHTVTGSEDYSSLSVSPTWNTSANVSAIKLNLTNTASGVNSKLFDLQLDSNSIFSISPTGNVVISGTVIGTGVASFGDSASVTTTIPHETPSNGTSIGYQPLSVFSDFTTDMTGMYRGAANFRSTNYINAPHTSGTGYYYGQYTVSTVESMSTGGVRNYGSQVLAYNYGSGTGSLSMSGIQGGVENYGNKNISDLIGLTYYITEYGITGKTVTNSTGLAIGVNLWSGPGNTYTNVKGISSDLSFVSGATFGTVDNLLLTSGYTGGNAIRVRTSGTDYLTISPLGRIYAVEGIGLGNNTNSANFNFFGTSYSLIYSDHDWNYSGGQLISTIRVADDALITSSGTYSSFAFYPTINAASTGTVNGYVLNGAISNNSTATDYLYGINVGAWNYAATTGLNMIGTYSETYNGSASAVFNYVAGLEVFMNLHGSATYTVSDGLKIGYSSGKYQGGNAIRIQTGSTDNFTISPTGIIYTKGGSLTGSEANSSVSIEPTWNTTGNSSVLFVNVTNTASGGQANLVNMQVDSSTKFFVDKSGYIGGTAIVKPTDTPTYYSGYTISDTPTIKATNVNIATFSRNGNVGYITISPSSYPTILSSPASATLQLGATDAAAPVAQTLGVQSVVAGTTNTSGANFTIKGSASTGSAAGGSIIFQVAPAGSSGTSQNAFVTALEINSSKQLLSSHSGSASAVSYATAAGGAYGLWGSGGSTFLQASSSAQLKLWSGGFLQMSDSIAFGWTTDTFLYRDAANILALRTSTNAQAFRVYKTYDGTNNAYLQIDAGKADSTTLAIWGVKSGSATYTNVDIGFSNTKLIRQDGTNLTIYGQNLLFGTDNTYDIGASGATRPRRLYLGGGSLTGSDADSSVEISPTWNTTGTPTAIKLDVTNTASGAASYLIDLKESGSSRFAVDINGVISSRGQAVIYGATTTRLYGGSSISRATLNDSGHFWLSDSGLFAFCNNSNAPAGAIDTAIGRNGPASLRFGAADSAAPVAQTLGVQSVVAGTTNTSGANFTIKGSAGTGTGTGGSIIFQVAPAGSSGTSQNAFADALTIYQSKKVTFGGSIGLGGIVPNTNDFEIYGANQAYINIGSLGHFRFVGAGATDIASFKYDSKALNLTSTGSVSWTNSTNSQGTVDLILIRDGAGTLALRQNTTAQAFRVYKTTDGGSNYAYATIDAGQSSSELVSIGSVSGGTGSLASLQFIVNNTSFLNYNWSVSNAWAFNADLKFGTDNAYDIGASGANRPRNLYIAGDATFGGTSLTFSTTSTVTTTTGGHNYLDTGAGYILRLNNVMGIRGGNNQGVVVGASFPICFGSDLSYHPTADVKLWRGAAGVLDLRNSTNAQSFHLYQTYTDASNYLRTVFTMAGGYSVIYASGSGTGAPQGVIIAGKTGATGSVFLRSNYVSSTGIVLDTSNAFRPETDNINDLGNSSQSFRTVYNYTEALQPVTYASLPTAAAGMIACVSDSTTTTWGATISGGGGSTVIAFYNGTNWTVMGA